MKVTFLKKLFTYESCLETNDCFVFSFQLTDDVDDGGDLSMQDPMKLLVQLNEKYHRQKTLYKMTRDYYYKLNLFVFYLPLLIVQGQLNSEVDNLFRKNTEKTAFLLSKKS